MYARTTTALLVLALACAGSAGCSSSGEPAADSRPTAPVTVTATATATEVATEEEIIEQCTDAVAEAAPGWDDWSVKVEGWKSDPRTPEVCKSLENLDYMDALIDGLNAADDPRASQ